MHELTEAIDGRTQYFEHRMKASVSAGCVGGVPFRPTKNAINIFSLTSN